MTKQHVILAMKSTLLLYFFIAVVFPSRPPLSGQQPSGVPRGYEVVPVITTEDVKQDDAIATLREKTELNTARIQKQWEAINANTNSIAGMQGESRVWNSLLTLLSGGSLALTATNNRRRRQEKQDE